MRVGYVRVSTPDQSFALQRDALEQSGCTKILKKSPVARRPPDLFLQPFSTICGLVIR